MSVGEELRDPWGWLVAGVTGGVGWAVLAAALAPPAAVAAGIGIGAAVLGTKVALGAARSGPGQSEPRRRQDRLPDVPRGSAQAEMLERCRSALARMDDLADRPSDPWIAEELSQVLADAGPVVAAMAEVAGRVTLLDSSIAAARPNRLAAEMAALQEQMRRTAHPGVRREQERALQALDAQADSVDRLLRRRDTLMAQMHTSTLGLEGLAARTGELVALGPASHDTDAATRIVDELTSSLDAVRAGIDEAREILRDL